MSGSRNLEGVHGTINALDLKWARRLSARLPEFQPNDGVLKRVCS